MQLSGIELSGAKELVQSAGAGSGTAFKDLVQDYFNRANDAQLKADQLVQNFASGADVDLHQVMIAVSEAQITNQLTLQLKNKMVETYQEIMRMQV